MSKKQVEDEEVDEVEEDEEEEVEEGDEDFDDGEQEEDDPDVIDDDAAWLDTEDIKPAPKKKYVLDYRKIKLSSYNAFLRNREECKWAL